MRKDTINTEANRERVQITQQPTACSILCRNVTLFLRIHWVWQVPVCPLMLWEKVGQARTVVDHSLIWGWSWSAPFHLIMTFQTTNMVIHKSDGQNCEYNNHWSALSASLKTAMCSTFYALLQNVSIKWLLHCIFYLFTYHANIKANWESNRKSALHMAAMAT